MSNEAETLNNAYHKCIDLAFSHYENFPVARLVAKRLRKHVAAIYAFARTADDIADENHDTIAEDDPIRVEWLREFESQLDIENAEDLDARWSWIFIALKNTITEFSIPVQLLRDLISAFAQDVVKKRYADFRELLDYCRRSANPVGRLVLILHNIRDEKLFALSDKICSALQLANFWQDMSVDKLKNRIYVPESDWNGLDEMRIFANEACSELRDVMKIEVERTADMFNEGAALIKSLPFPLNAEIKLTLSGGKAILSKIREQDYDTLKKRPKISKLDKVKILLSVLRP